MIRVSIKRLRKICQKPDEIFKKDKIYNFTSIFYRYISIYITKLFIKTNITPNQITIVSALIILVAAAFFGMGSTVFSIYGIFLLHLYWIFDLCDGEVARYKKMASFNGSFLDLIGHVIIFPLVFISISIGLFRQTGDFYLLFLGFSATFFNAAAESISLCKNHALFQRIVKVSQTGKIPVEMKYTTKNRPKKELYAGPVKENESFIRNLVKNLLSVYRSPVNIIIISLFIIFNIGHIMLMFYGITLPLVVAIKFVNEFRAGTSHLEYLFDYFVKK